MTRLAQSLRNVQHKIEVKQRISDLLNEVDVAVAIELLLEVALEKSVKENGRTGDGVTMALQASDGIPVGLSTARRILEFVKQRRRASVEEIAVATLGETSNAARDKVRSQLSVLAQRHPLRRVAPGEWEYSEKREAAAQ